VPGVDDDSNHAQSVAQCAASQNQIVDFDVLAVPASLDSALKSIQVFIIVLKSYFLLEIARIFVFDRFKVKLSSAHRV